MARGTGQWDGKMGATRGLCLRPEMPSRVKGCVHRDKITTEPQKEAILEWRLGRGEMTSGDSDESAEEEGEGRKKEREKRQETMGSLAASLGEDHIEREVTACHRCELLLGAGEKDLN